MARFVGFDRAFLELVDADLHDFRDSPATREVYVYDSVRLGIRRNRSRVLVRLDDVVAITRFDDILGIVTAGFPLRRHAACRFSL